MLQLSVSLMFLSHMRSFRNSLTLVYGKLQRDFNVYENEGFFLENRSFCCENGCLFFENNTNFHFRKTNSHFTKQTSMFEEGTPIFAAQTPILTKPTHFREKTPILYKHRFPFKASLLVCNYMNNVMVQHFYGIRSLDFKHLLKCVVSSFSSCKLALHESNKLLKLLIALLETFQSSSLDIGFFTANKMLHCGI